MASGPLWGLPAGQGDWEDLWRGSQCPPLPHFLGACPALPCCGILPAPPLNLLAQPVWAAGELCWCPAAPAARAVEEAWWRAKGASGASGSACRESTAALKAWLGRHRQNPYPTKGEKVLLALLSRMSLTQVSTWFANARRRLKKERRHRPAPDAPPTPPDARPPRQHQHHQDDQPPRKPAKIWSLAELAARPPDAPAPQQ